MPAPFRRRPESRLERAPRGARSVLRLGQAVLWLAGAVLLGWCGLAYLEARSAQRDGDRVLEEMLREDASPAEERADGTNPPTAARDGDPELIGRIEIPRLGIASIVREGTSRRTLDLAVGHVAGTALPGERGNVCLAGHRDTFFRQLEGVRKTDTIRVTTPKRTVEYEVERISVVEPGDVGVLAPTDHGTLTLVTCFPFAWVGPAPRRFIVRARQRDPSRPGTDDASGFPGEQQMFESKTIVAIAAGALLLGSPAFAQQTQTTKKTEEKTVSTSGEMDKTTETTVKSPAGKTKAKTHTVVGTVKEFVAGKSIKVATSSKKSQKFALDAKDVATTVAPEVAVGVKVKVVQATDATGIKSLTISKD